MNNAYVHGYALSEGARLQDQALTLTELLHWDTFYPPGSKVLEAGCGIGAQTITLAQRSPKACFTSIDISAASIAQARKTAESKGLTNVNFQQGDIFNLSFGAESFDHVFVCFVFEHLRNVSAALAELKKLIRPGGTITIIEGDHGSTFFYPDSEAARKAIQSLVELQSRAGGNALIGRELYPLLIKAGFDSVSVSPRMVYVDSSKPELVEGFTEKTFTAMIEGVRKPVIEAGLIDPLTFDEGIKGLCRTAESDGVFCYTFFKAVAKK